VSKVALLHPVKRHWVIDVHL